MRSQAVPAARPRLSAGATNTTVATARAFDHAPEPEVRTAAGVLQGSHEAGLAVFRGVPYAEPTPPQAGLFGSDELAQQGAGVDWLSVNVRSPYPAAGSDYPCWCGSPRRLRYRTSNLPEFDGSRLAAGSVVAVVEPKDELGHDGLAPCYPVA